MEQRLETALIELGIRLAGAFVEQVIIPWLRSLIEDGVDPPSALGVATEIVRGIDDAHPTWSDDDKRDMALAAIHQHLVRQGGSPKLRDTSLLLEAAVQRARATWSNAGAPPDAIGA